jgi:glycosyltransferase involved in cell wall biosynthesis
VIEVGPIADEQRAAFYSLADIYVSPSLLEGLGLTPIEAQACGTPAIVTDALSGREEVGDAGSSCRRATQQRSPLRFARCLTTRRGARRLARWAASASYGCSPTSI